MRRKSIQMESPPWMVCNDGVERSSSTLNRDRQEWRPVMFAMGSVEPSALNLRGIHMAATDNDLCSRLTNGLP